MILSRSAVVYLYPRYEFPSKKKKKTINLVTKWFFCFSFLVMWQDISILSLEDLLILALPDSIPSHPAVFLKLARA